MSYTILVQFAREWSDDTDLVEGQTEYAGLSYREAFKRQFHAELQGAYDDSEGALAGHFTILSVQGGTPNLDKELDQQVSSPDPRVAALRRIKWARDYHADYGVYPANTVKKNQTFDNWAANVAEKALEI